MEVRVDTYPNKQQNTHQLTFLCTKFLLANMVPIIDLENFPKQSQPLLDACVSWGCFRIINHRIPATLMADMKSAVATLLDLPPEIKRRNTDVVVGSGYASPTETNPLYEGLGLYDLADDKAVDEFCTQLNATSKQREIIFKYSKAVHELAMDVGNKIAQAMGISGNLLEDWPCQFRINKYNFTQETIGSSGVQIHTDSGFLTILQDDEKVSGLEVLDKKSSDYVAIDPMPGSFLVNLGDVATIWSNGNFYNVKHRVQCKEAAIRVSIALFVLGPRETLVEAPPQLVGPENPRLYVPIAFENYRKLRFSTNLRAGETLDLLHTSSKSSKIVD